MGLEQLRPWREMSIGERIEAVLLIFIETLKMILWLALALALGWCSWVVIAH